MKKWIVSLLAILIVGMAGTITIYLTTGISRASVIAEESFQAGEITRIQVAATSMNVTVKSQSSDQIEATVKGDVLEKDQEEQLYQIEQTDDTLMITQKEKENRVGFLPWDTAKNLHVTVSVPEKLYDNVSIETTSGDIVLDHAETANAQITSTSGDVDLTGDKITDSLVMEATSGDIQAENNTIESATIRTTSGTIKNKQVEGSQFEYEATSGDVVLSHSGEIAEVNVETTSGDVSVEYDLPQERFEVDFQSSSGDGRVSMEEVLFEEKSEHNIHGFIGENPIHVLKVRTSSGDFRLKGR
ncbi:DUF4097 family beta strand repeat-containing protein [Sediminibacillus halophilus]|uniref:DUF4097 and DUF4098 domain-containing protein YvlB n=1 Tax=Sediminibacillus halophilus TaxID=482461 RepID=A0A1G9VGX5_9BACI|nr:DUF4097 family beta strand repeat-containing protein [Sediminibacillus halophilus]SDM71311.1 DUF4097 and DUF4098 domain-containing protein YvlB [Sediminibacillus halophilus]